MAIKRRTVANVSDEAFSRATPEQAETLAKMLPMKWKITQVITRNGKSAIALTSKNTGAWLMPNGKLLRPKIGESAAQLDLKMLD